MANFLIRPPQIQERQKLLQPQQQQQADPLAVIEQAMRMKAEQKKDDANLNKMKINRYILESNLPPDFLKLAEDAGFAGGDYDADDVIQLILPNALKQFVEKNPEFTTKQVYDNFGTWADPKFVEHLASNASDFGAAQAQMDQQRVAFNILAQSNPTRMNRSQFMAAYHEANLDINSPEFNADWAGYSKFWEDKDRADEKAREEKPKAQKPKAQKTPDVNEIGYSVNSIKNLTKKYARSVTVPEASSISEHERGELTRMYGELNSADQEVLSKSSAIHAAMLKSGDVRLFVQGGAEVISAIVDGKTIYIRDDGKVSLNGKNFTSPSDSLEVIANHVYNNFGAYKQYAVAYRDARAKATALVNYVSKRALDNKLLEAYGN